MASPFYVWDPVQHAGLPTSIPQAENFAIQHPQADELPSAALIAWFEHIQQFVLSSEHSSCMDEKVIYDMSSLTSWFGKRKEVVLEIENMHIEGGDYFYRELIQSLQRFKLAAYDSYRGIFVCQQYTLPASADTQLASLFAAVINPNQSLGLALDVLPQSLKQFEKLLNDWFAQHDYAGSQFKLSQSILNPKNTYEVHARENEFIYEELVIVGDYRSRLSIDFRHTIYLKPLAGLGENLATNYSIYPESTKYANMPICQYANMPICQYANYINNTQQLQDFFALLSKYIQGNRKLSSLFHRIKFLREIHHSSLIFSTSTSCWLFSNAVLLN